MSTQDDKTIAWQGRIQEKAATATKAILDRLATMPKSGLTNLSPTERRDLSETIAKQIVDTMATLGTFVTAGAQDFQVCNLEQVTIGKAGKVSMKLVPIAGESGGVNLGLLAANADKQVVVAMINGLAYSQARESLSKAITREQTDWVQRSHDEDLGEVEMQAVAEKPTQHEPVDTSDAGLPVFQAIDNQLTGDLIAEQPGDADGHEQENAGEPESAPAAGGDSASDTGGSAPADGGSVSDAAAGASEDNASPLARAGRRVRRRTDQPTAH